MLQLSASQGMPAALWLAYAAIIGGLVVLICCFKGGVQL